MELPDICDECRYVPGAGRDRRGFLTVVDGSAVRRVCTMCALQLLSRVNRGLRLTLVLGGEAAEHPRTGR